jgi:hypothetical protein
MEVTEPLAAAPRTAQGSLCSPGSCIPNMVEDPKDCIKEGWIDPPTHPPLQLFDELATLRKDPKIAKESTEQPSVEKKASSRNKGLFEFSNTDALKKKVRDEKIAKARKPYNVHDKYKTQGFFQWLAKNERFDNCTLSVIVINAFWMAFDTDGNTADTILEAGTVYVIMDCLFFGYFSVEVCVRFIAFKNKRDCLKDGWFKFDATLVALYAFDPFFIGLLAFIQGGGGLNLPTAILRLFRLARLSRLVRMLRSLPELMVMIKGMVTASASVSYTLALLMIITYVFAIALRNIVPPDSDIETLYFESVPEAMHNLIVFGTFMDSLAQFIYDVKAASPICFIFCWMYIGLAALTVMNMLIGVLCEVISSVAASEAESLQIDRVNEKFDSIINEIDENNDGRLSWDEFNSIIDHPETLAALEAVDVDPDSMIDMAEDYFFEDGGQPVELEFGDFIMMLLDLRGGQTATVKNIMGLGRRMTGKFEGVNRRVDAVEKAVKGLDEKMDNVMSSLNDIASYIKEARLVVS